MSLLAIKNKFVGLELAIFRSGLISEDDLSQAIKDAKESGTDTISYLFAKELVGETQLAHIISKQLGFSYFDLERDFDEHLLPKDLVEDSFVVRHKVLPLFIKESTLIIAISNPKSIKFVNEICFSAQLKAEIKVAEPRKIAEIIDAHFGQYDERGSVSAEDLVRSLGNVDDEEGDTREEIITLANSDSNAPIVSFINKLLMDAIRQKASDLHFEPFEKNYRVRYRIDGILQLIETLPIMVANRFSSRLKVMAGMDISEKRTPQDGRIRLKISDSKAIDFRVSSLPVTYGEKLVLRILDPSSAKLGIDSLGYESEQKAMFMEALHKPQGMILITGPTGSGKTVSLYTGLNILNRLDCNISTAEDPVEIDLDGVNQVNVNPKTGLTFASALRAFLRQDPDIIMVGEIRDLETAEIAIKAAQTGHMVMSTLHTNSASETLTRLRNMGVPAFNVATSVSLVIAQRLARKLCSACCREADIPEKTLLDVGFTEDDIKEGLKIYEAVGCNLCTGGYKGRVGVYEVMKVTPTISKLIMTEANAIEIAEASAAAGFDNLRRSGLRKVKAGFTTIQEVMRITSD